MGPKLNLSGRTKVVKAVQTPLGLLALGLLVIEGLLVGLTAKATGTNLTVLIVGCLLSLLLLIVVVAILFYRFGLRESPVDADQPAPPPPIYDLFISSPMAAFATDEEYKQNRAELLTLISAFEKECKFNSIIYAGKKLTSMDDFEAADISAADDLRAVRESRFFLLHYPAKLASSVLCEAGMALALHKPSLILAKDREDLPFLLRQVEAAFHNVKVYEYKNMESFIALIKAHRDKIFPPCD